MEHALQNQISNNEQTEERSEEQPRVPSRVRRPTLMKLQWLAERLRKCERIKRDLEEESYSVDSAKVARALLNIESGK